MEKRWVWWKILLYIWAFACPIALCIYILNVPIDPMVDSNEAFSASVLFSASLVACAGAGYGIVKKSSIWYFIIPFAGVVLGFLMIKALILWIIAYSKNLKYEEERAKNKVHCKHCGKDFDSSQSYCCEICGSFDIIKSYDMGSQVFCKRCNSYRPGTNRCPHCGGNPYR